MSFPARRRVVVVDDNVRDIELFTTACELGGIEVDIASFTDGRAAIDDLRQRVLKPSSALPDTIVLDLNMPGATGFDVLQFIRSLDALRGLRVYILTTSSSPKDRERCQAMGCDGYLVKPPSFSAFVDLLKTVLAGAQA